MPALHRCCLCYLLILPQAFGQAETPAQARYAAVAQALEPFIAREVERKGLPALSIALVDDQAIVWAKGFGFADPKTRKPATAETVYRVGSVSKLFTDLAVMRLVEQGKLDLDAPVTRYLPDFKPKLGDRPFGKARVAQITLRQMMAHRSGLVREPPVGNYFDDASSSLADTVKSLNATELVYEPETRTKYSNAAIATVGYVLEVTQKERFPEYLRREILDPLGLKKSGFEPAPELTKDLAKALMWSYHGRTFDAPTFELGMAPAGSMYSTVNDLGRFLSVLFAQGKGPGAQIVKPATLQQMWTRQFAHSQVAQNSKAEERNFGIGFMLSELEGKRRIGHGGAIYGFASELAALPDEKLGVVVVASKDVANAVVQRIANEALRHMLAIRLGQPLPKIEESRPLDPERAQKLAGRYQAGERLGERKIDLEEYSGRLYLQAHRGGFRQELHALGDDLVVDDVVAVDFDPKIRVEGGDLRIGEDLFKRVSMPKPAPPPERWLGLIGEYGWDHNVLYILEKDGKLHALIEWFFLYPLEEESEQVFKFPDWGLYHDEKLIFKRNAQGQATQVEAANVVFKRRSHSADFRIMLRRPIEELRKESLAAQPPGELGDALGAEGRFAKQDLVELVKLDPTIKLDVRYATGNNFLGTPVYTTAAAYLQRPAAEALVRVHRKLKEQGYGLLIHDGYRPWYVTRMFWEATPDRHRLFVADPAQGSRHNRGCAVDLTLYDLKTGKAVEMPGGYDEFSDRSYPLYPGGTSLQRWHRDLLRRAMEPEGFTVFAAEWWHFDYREWKKYPIGNATFEELRRD